MKAIYCSNCGKEREVKLISRKEEYAVRGEKTSVESRVYVCETCNEDIFNEQLDAENLERLYSKYRERHRLLSPNRIKDIRKKYGLSQRSMSRLLEWGEITFSRYENGSIQDSVHNEVLELIEKPENMLVIFEKNKTLLLPKEREKLSKRLEDLISSENKGKNFINIFEAYLTNDESMDIYTGFKRFDLEKTKNLILYIIMQSPDIMKTKVNKLLFYIDFLFFKTFSVSLTGNKYIHLQFGPIPNDYDFILNLMEMEGLIDKKEIIFNRVKNIVGEELGAKKKISKNVFTDDELKIVNFCIKKFKSLNCVQISKHSHKEKAFKDTKEKEAISYELAQNLSLSFGQ